MNKYADHLEMIIGQSSQASALLRGEEVAQISQATPDNWMQQSSYLI